MQAFLRKYFGWLIDGIATLVGNTNWTQSSQISKSDQDTIMEMLKKDYYIICTRHRNHLSTYAIGLAGLFSSGKFGFYAHVLMNLEDEVNSPDDFRLVEAVGTGSQYSTFQEVFDNPDAVCLLKPKKMSTDHWTAVMDKAKTQVGKPYDTLFDLTSDKAVSCVELVRAALQGEPNYATDFAEFEKMISKINNLTPQMFRDCPDFEVVYEVKR